MGRESGRHLNGVLTKLVGLEEDALFRKFVEFL